MRVVYVAAPVSPIVGETREGNLERARQLYRALCLKHPDTLFLVPWLINCEVFEETLDFRAIGMARNFRAIDLCDELWLVGPRVSHGMDEEAGYAVTQSILVRDLTSNRSARASLHAVATVPRETA